MEEISGCGRRGIMRSALKNPKIMRAYSTVIVALLVVACTTLSTRAFNPNANIATGGARQRLQVARSAQVSDYTPTSTPLKSSVSRSTFIRTLSFTPLLPALLLPSPSLAVPEIFTTDKGVKYAITQKATTNQVRIRVENSKRCAFSS